MKFCKSTLLISLVLATAGCYWSSVPLIKNEDIFEYKGYDIKLTENEWANLTWNKTDIGGTLKMLSDNSDYRYFDNYDKNRNAVLAFERMPNGFIVVQKSEVNSKDEIISYVYGLAYILGQEIFFWDLKDWDTSRSLKNHDDVILFDECYKSVYGKIPEDKRGSETSYSYKTFLQSDLSECANYIMFNHIAPDRKMSINYLNR